ncbi:radical SAM domain-containing protein, partial [Candidatus Magnetomorum sp. HK-1]
LLNINHPSKYLKKSWNQLLDNISVVCDKRIILSLNINKENFEYDYLLDIATKFDVKYIRWSFAHPIYKNTEKQFSQNYFPISRYKQITKRILNFIEKAGSLGIHTLGDHSVILCMFTPEEIDKIHLIGGELNSKCEGTIDILPDLQVIYCIPMYSFFPKVYLYEFSSLSEIDLYFESRIIPFRIESYPFTDCYKCEYSASGKCHGGCIAQGSIISIC